MRKKSNIVIITDAFPFCIDTEPCFILPELPAIAKQFERVIIMPTIKCSSQQNYSLPANISIDISWLNHPQWRHKWMRLPMALHPEVISAALDSWSDGMKAAYSSMTYAASALTFKRFIKKWMKNEGLSADDTFFYTFWFDFPTSALGLLHKENPSLDYISRAHNHDIIMTRAHALRQNAIIHSKGIFTASDEGCRRLRKSFNLDRDRKELIDVRRLGSSKPAPDVVATHHHKSENELTFLSVARVAPVKRVHLNLQLLEKLAIARPSLNIKWIHVGNGSEMQHLRQLISKIDLPNLTIDLRGMMPNEAVHEIYRSEKIDWVMLLSEIEGLPICLCEALSYGVPLIGTDVDGTNEIVDDDNGLLLPADPEPEEFVRGILPYIDSEARYNALREAALRCWQTNFDSRPLRQRFAEEIALL